MTFPGHHKAAVIKRRYRRVILFAAGVGINLELVTETGAIRVITLAINAITGSILAAGLPGDNKAAIQKCRNIRHFLLTRGVGIGLELVADSVTILVVTLAINAITGSILIVSLPGNNKATIGKTRCRRCRLIVLHMRINPELVTISGAVGIITLAINAIVRSALGITVTINILALRLPGDNKTAILKRRDGGVSLCIRCLGIDQERVINNIAVDVKPLAVNAGAGAVLIARPASDKAAILEARHGNL